MRLSIIVPIYKVENYLHKCVDSLLQQDLSPEEYEIILVDDGSPDGCGAICDNYASQYCNIKVIHRPNGGLSAARNSGINDAQGDYVQFVDSDDYLEPSVLKTLIEKMDADHLDILRFNYQNVNERYEVFAPDKDPKCWVDYSDSVCDGLSFLNERLGPACYAWQFMIRRELLEGCAFTEGIYFEDTEWTPRVMLRASRVSSVDTVAYNYLTREGSITQSVDVVKKKKVLNDKLLLVDSMLLQKQSVADNRWFDGMIAQVVISIINYLAENFYEDRRPVLRKLKEKKVFPLSFYLSNAPAKRKIVFANVSPDLLCMLLHLKR